MYKLLLLGTMIGIGVGIAKFMKKKKQIHLKILSY